MHQIKRPQHLFLQIEDHAFVDVDELLRGELRMETRPRLQILSVLSQEAYSITTEDLQLLLRVPSHRWIEPGAVLRDSDAAPERLRWLLERGVLLSSSEEDPHARRVRADRQLQELGWHPNAALFHFMGRTSGPGSSGSAAKAASEPQQKQPATSEEVFAQQVETYGPPPPAFHRRASLSSLPLPEARGEGRLYRTLLERKTRRGFDRERSLSRESLATLLYYSFGCQATTRLSEEVLALRRCSPSGGSLHPVEVYPLVVRVEGLEPGCYHYNSERHCLDLLQRLDGGEIGNLLVELAAGQSYARNVQVMLLLTARFYRNFWKYREIARTYGVILMDAGHIGQNLYLVAAELGLSGFFSAAMDGAKVEELLALDPIEEGSIAIFGCGLPAASPSPVDLVREPFDR